MLFQLDDRVCRVQSKLVEILYPSGAEGRAIAPFTFNTIQFYIEGAPSEQ